MPKPSAQFRRKFNTLILMAWLVPPVFGLATVLYIGILSPDQLLGILSTPVEPAFILCALFFALWYLPRVVRSIPYYLDNPDEEASQAVMNCLQTFPIQFWGVFLSYLAIAPSTVILSAEWFTDFVAQPVDWFRIHLVALIVSIIVGLPIFFLIYDLIGRTIGQIQLSKAFVTVKAKVFLIGALVPLLIDTMLVQYYWTRTGFFTFETFVVWLSLELLAIVGSLVFVRSIGQSIAPLQQFIADPGSLETIETRYLNSMSTDEFGVLTSAYKKLLSNLQTQAEILALNNRLLRDIGTSISLEDVALSVINLAQKSLHGEMAFLALYDKQTQELVGVIHSGVSFNSSGHFRLSLDEISLPAAVFKGGTSIAVDDVHNDARCNPRMVKEYGNQSALAVPLTIEGQTVGVLTVTTVSKSHHYTEKDITILEGLAGEVALAAHNHDLRAAHEAATRDLRESQAMLQKVLNTIPVRVFWKDRDLHYLGGNKLFARDAGFSSMDQVMGKDDSQLIWAEQAQVYQREDKGVLQNKRAVLSFEESQITSEGGLICREISKIPLLDSEGEVIGILGAYTDISERKRVEEELRRHREHLEEMVQDRTDELLRVNKELESFSYSVSHDLRAPLRAIDGFSLALAEDYEDRLDETGQDYLRRIRNGAQRMESLIDDLLQLARVSRHSLSKKKIDLSQLAKTITDRLQQTHPEHNIEFAIQSGLSVNADEVSMEVVLENLLDNAVKYSGKCKHAKIDIASKRVDGETAYYIRDNGVGFDAQYMDKLFVAFQRLHSDSEFPGTGIGLATVARVVHKHGGRVWAEAKLDEGATFYFTLK